jgi:HK97 family phage major capsid protein
MTTNTVTAAIAQLEAGAGKALASHRDAIDGLLDRVERIESVADRPKGTTLAADRNEVEHKERFLQWIRAPREGSVKRQLDEAQDEMRQYYAKHEGKAVSIGSDAAGGYAVPALIQSEVEKRVTTLNPFRQLAKVVRIGSSDYAHLVSKNAATSGWVGESATRTETGTSELIERKPTGGTIYAYPKATEESLQDIYFDVGAWLVEEIGDSFAAAEASAFVSGDGTNKPTGFTVGAVATLDDASPERAPGALKFLTPTSSPEAIDADDLIRVSLDIKSGYMLDPSAVAWVMNRSTASTIRQLKDSYGQYLWQPSIQSNVPSMLLGYPVFLTDAMPAATSGNFPIAFGNFRRGYLIGDRSEMRLTIDDSISTPGIVKFYARKRVFGSVLNHEAVRLLGLS